MAAIVVDDSIMVVTSLICHNAHAHAPRRRHGCRRTSGLRQQLHGRLTGPSICDWRDPRPPGPCSQDSPSPARSPPRRDEVSISQLQTARLRTVCTTVTIHISGKTQEADLRCMCGGGGGGGAGVFASPKLSEL